MQYQAPKGTYDVLPYGVEEEWQLSDLWQHVESTARQISSDFAYREIRTPIYESTALFDRGVGETSDIVTKEMFTFETKGGDNITLRPENTAGVGGLYDILGPSSRTVEDASYIKLREVSVGYRFGKIAGRGDWTLSLVGRNLKTWTNYNGFDPEVGLSGGTNGSGALNAIDAYTFPNLRTFTLTLTTSF